MFILIGTGVDRQLPTILSRCQVVRFAPLAHDCMVAVLRRHEIQDPSQLERLCRLADGSPGQALALAEPELWEFRKKLVEGLTRPKIDTIGLGKEFAAFAERAGKDASLQRRRAALVLRLLIEALTDALSLSLGAEAKSTDPEDLWLLRTLTNRASPEKFIAMVERCLESEQQIDRYIQLTLVLDALLNAIGQLLEEGAFSTAAQLTVSQRILLLELPPCRAAVFSVYCSLPVAAPIPSWMWKTTFTPAGSGPIKSSRTAASAFRRAQSPARVFSSGRARHQRTRRAPCRAAAAARCPRRTAACRAPACRAAVAWAACTEHFPWPLVRTR